MPPDGAVTPDATGRLRIALASGGSTWLLSSRDSGGALRTRPVTVWWDPADLDAPAPVVHVLTGADGRKAADLEREPEVTVSGPVPGGWFAAGGRTQVVRDPAAVVSALRRIAPRVPAQGVAVLRITLLEARRWSVASDRPFDNSVEQLLGAG